jgi:hypothetical protein
MTHEEEREIEKFIESAPVKIQAKLRKLQQECDDIREQYKGNHLKITAEIFKLMATKTGTQLIATEALKNEILKLKDISEVNDEL